jgi:DNA-binding response OmpR family regulator
MIVEDDPVVATGLSDFISNLGHELICARDGKQALDLFRDSHPDLVLLDLVLPRMSGMEVCRRIREQGDPTPIIMVTAKGQPHDRVAGLDLGADDYITKPFDLDELAARIRAVLRRATAADQSNGRHQLGDEVVVDLDRFVIERGGQQFELNARERDILALFISRANQVVSRNEILDHVWGTEAYPSTRTVDNYMVSLRKKLEKDPANPNILLGIRSVGYKLIKEP